MRIKLSRDAELFLRSEHRYLEDFNPRAADTVLRQLQAALRLLTEYPQAGRLDDPEKGRRRYVTGDYIIFYRVEGRSLAVSHIRHGRQHLPEPERGPDIDDGI